MVILVSSKKKEDPIKIEGARVAIIQNIDFSNIKGQLTAFRGQIWPKFKSKLQIQFNLECDKPNDCTPGHCRLTIDIRSVLPLIISVPKFLNLYMGAFVLYFDIKQNKTKQHNRMFTMIVALKENLSTLVSAFCSFHD